MATRWLRIGSGGRATRALTAMVLTTVVLATLLWWFLNSELGLGRWLARSWARRLPESSAEQVSRDLRYIAALDEAGLDTLLDAFGSSRSAVSESAAQALRERLDVWRQGPSERSNELAGQLARGLAERVSGWPAAPRRVAADIALQLLDWPIDTPRESRSQLLADCEQILRSVPAVSAANRDTSTKPSEPKRLGVKGAGDLPGLLTGPSTSVNTAKGELAEPEQMPNLDLGLAIQPALTRSSETAPTDPSTGFREPSQIELGGSLSESEDRLLSTGTPALDTLGLSEAAQTMKTPISQRPDLELIHDLGSTHEETKAKARQELERRGFREYDFKLAAKLIDPSPAQRRQVAHLVYGLSSGAGRWLIWLSEDPDRSVRQAAVSLMVTTQDPLVQRRLLKMEVTDRDGEICERIREWRERR